VFESASGSSIHEAFAERVADPVGMEDYRPRDVHYVRRGDVTERILGNDSEHPAYVFMVSGRDLARFGLLYLAGGRWRDEQVVPRSWVERTTTDTVATFDFLEGDRYGYLWWVSPPKSALGRVLGHASFKATGGRGHKVLVVPGLDLVVVHRLATGGAGLASQLYRRFTTPPNVDDQQFQELMRRIVAAHPDSRRR
jgi:CubicO group peptidase (beta-lactamase class C family)